MECPSKCKKLCQFLIYLFIYLITIVGQLVRIINYNTCQNTIVTIIMLIIEKNDISVKIPL